MTPYHYTSNNPINRIDPDGRWDWVKNKEGEIYWDKNANDQATTKKGEEYLGKTLTFQFTSYIDGKLWDGPSPPGIDPAGVKLTSTINVTGNENSSGELTSISVGKHVQPGDTPVGTPRLTYPGLGSDQNKFDLSSSNSGISVKFEQHASVSRVEEFGLNAMGYSIVNVAQKLDLNYSKGSGNLSVSAATDVFPSAKLTLNGQKIMQYNQPSFKATHSKTSDSYKPANWYKRL